MIQKIQHKIKHHGYFMLFILVFAYVQSIHSRIAVRQEVNAYIFTPEAAFVTAITVSILFVIISFFIKYWQKSDVFSTKEMVIIFGSSLLVYMLIMQLFGLIIALIFNTLERNFNQETFILSSFSNLLDGFIYGSFFLSYYYYIKNKKKQQQLAIFNQALLESRISQLKTQLNPHFLFNNLNVLDQLIEEDKNKASDFLNEFAEIYRYVLQGSDKKLVTIDEELTFAKQYFKLIQHKYGNAYQLIIESKNNKGSIVPLTLQLLIENAVQHNLGSITHPVRIKIEESENLCVLNNSIPKKNMKTTSGRALTNLKEQYKLLTNKPIKITKTNDTFSVTIPIIPIEKK